MKGYKPMANKVKFGLKNCHYALVTETFSDSTGEWTTTYGVPQAVPGSVHVSLSKEEARNLFYADNSAYYETKKNNGYTGSYELAKVPASVLMAIFGQIRDKNGLLVESESDKTKYVALMFEIDGDEKATKFCLFKVSLQKPDIEAGTTTESTEVNTDSCDLTVMPRLDDGRILCRADEETDEAAYNSFYDAVPTLDFSA